MVRMRVGDSIKLAVDDWELQRYDGRPERLESAMLHACNAVDGTAKKKFGSALGNRERFERLLRDRYDVLLPMSGMGTRPDTQFTTRAGPVGDLAAVVYKIHRCFHGHGDELPEGFALLPNLSSEGTIFIVSDAGIQLPDRIIFALLAVAIGEPVNLGQTVPDRYHLTYRDRVMPINELWGEGDAIARILAGSGEVPEMRMDFGGWAPTREDPSP